jgi:hypothetical protein
MSDASQDERELFSANLRRINAEGAKLMAEQQKFGIEQQKLAAEQFKLFMEGRKLDRDRLLAPVIAIGGLFVGGMGLLVAFLRH